MTGNTSIQISRDNKFELDKLKLTASETYDEVITRLLQKFTEETLAQYTLYNGIFHIDCEADFEDDHWYFLDDYGNQKEFLEPRESFVDDGIQKEYENFIKAINLICHDCLNLFDYGAELNIGEVHEFDGFKMKRIS